jgi:hypothetical protein
MPWINSLPVKTYSQRPPISVFDVLWNTYIRIICKRDWWRWSNAVQERGCCIFLSSVDKCSHRPNATFLFLSSLLFALFCNVFRPHSALVRRNYSYQSCLHCHLNLVARVTFNKKSSTSIKCWCLLIGNSALPTVYYIYNFVMCWCLSLLRCSSR